MRRVAGDGATVSVMGGVADPGVYPIEAPTRRLSSMLAQAGGVAVVPDVAQIKMERGGRTGRIWLQDLYDNPALRRGAARRRPHHRRGGPPLLHRARRRHRAGAGAVQQARHVGGRGDRRRPAASTAAPPTRPASSSSARRPAEIANRVLGRADLVGPQRMAYLLDLTKPGRHVRRARLHHPRRGHHLHHRGAARLVGPDSAPSPLPPSPWPARSTSSRPIDAQARFPPP